MATIDDSKAYTRRFVLISTLDTDGQVPERIQVLPFGQVVSTKGTFLVDEESQRAIVSRYTRQGNDLVIDYEHQTLGGGEAPAAGWIKELEDRGQEGLWAKVEWTPRAREYLVNKEYRYFSPVVLVRVSDGKAVAIHSIGLTNTPAVSGMMPLVNKDDELVFEEEEKNVEELVKQLRSSLGLDEKATREEIVSAVKALKDKNESAAVLPREVLDLLELSEGASLADVKGRVIALKNPSGYVRAEEFKALQDKLAQRDRDELVSLALTTGKISPAQKAWAEEYALKDPEGFKAFVAATPQVVPLQKQVAAPTSTTGTAGPDDTQVLINKMLGISEEDFKKFGGIDDDGIN